MSFDRGTLLLRGVDRGVAELPGAQWDERVDALRAPAFRYREWLRTLGDRGLRCEIGALPALGARWADFELRPYQRAALDGWGVADERGLVVLPTGSGKTRVALAAIARADVPALVIAPTIALVEQWRVQLSAAWGRSVGQIGGGLRDIQAITVATFESAYRHMATIGHQFGLLVVDEVHHFGSGVRAEALEMSIAPKRLGLTATCPTDEIQLERLTNLMGPVVYQRSMSDLIGTYLAPLSRISVPVHLTPDERIAYRLNHDLFKSFEREARRRMPQADWAELLRFGMRSTAGQRALRAWRDLRGLLAYCSGKRAVLGRLLDRHHGARVLVFCADNAAAYAIARQHLLMPITCDIGRDERARMLARFAAGELRGLVSARVLNEGVDLPSAEVAIVVSAALGEREHIQRVGRILRPAEGKEALLYELVAHDTLEVSWSKRRSRGFDPGERVRLRRQQPADHSALPWGG